MTHPSPLALARLLTLLGILLLAPLALADESKTVADSAATFIDATSSEAVPGSAWGSVSSGGGSSSPFRTEDKKRVPKKETRKKGEGSSADDDDDDDSDDCVGSCFGSFLGSLFDDDDDDVVYYAPAPPPAAPDRSRDDTGYTASDEPDTDADYAPLPDRPRDPVAIAPFDVHLDLSWWKTGPSALSSEYKYGGFHSGLGSAFALGGTSASAFTLDLEFGFSGARGYPEFDYETATRLDSPQRTYLWIVDGGVRFGMTSRASDSALFRWGLGPRVFWVKESADIDVYTMPGMSFVEATTTEHEAWRLGGDIAASMMWGADDVLMGVAVRAFFIPWKGKGVESLTTDFIGKRTIAGGSIGFIITSNGL